MKSFIILHFQRQFRVSPVRVLFHRIVLIKQLRYSIIIEDINFFKFIFYRKLKKYFINTPRNTFFELS